jgi:hypothetical protein
MHDFQSCREPSLNAVDCGVRCQEVLRELLLFALNGLASPLLRLGLIPSHARSLCEHFPPTTRLPSFVACLRTVSD